MGHAGEPCTGSPPSAQHSRQPCDIEGTQLGMPARDILKSRWLPRRDLSVGPAWGFRAVGDPTCGPKPSSDPGHKLSPHLTGLPPGARLGCRGPG